MKTDCDTIGTDCETLKTDCETLKTNSGDPDCMDGCETLETQNRFASEFGSSMEVGLLISS